MVHLLISGVADLSILISDVVDVMKYCIYAPLCP